MTTMATELMDPAVDEALDLSDLDLLDDTRDHVFCQTCCGPVGSTSIALCGAIALVRDEVIITHPQTGCCPECESDFNGPCPTCGRTW